MSEFINTIDVIGDDAVIDSIIQKTITEFKDNRVEKIGDYAFNNCTALETVELPNAKQIGQQSFVSCVSLDRISFPAVSTIGRACFDKCSGLTSLDCSALTAIERYGFQYCTALGTLILRNGTVCKLYNIDAFISTPIASGTGLIYVPAALVDSYKSASNWSTYASQFRALEDYTVDGTVTGELDESKILGG